MRYHWFEEDGSWLLLPYNKTYTFLTQSNTTLTYTIRIGGADDVIGYSTVFFTDLTWQNYLAANGDMKIWWYMGPF
jgi:hypothetical protein